jgi:hypothetical protein
MTVKSKRRQKKQFVRSHVISKMQLYRIIEIKSSAMTKKIRLLFTRTSRFPVLIRFQWPVNFLKLSLKRLLDYEKTDLSKGTRAQSHFASSLGKI